MYLETSSPRLENDTARLFSPVFPAPSSPNSCFTFWYHMYGLTTGSLNVYLHHHDSVLLFSQSGDQGNQWKQAVLPLPPLDSNFQIVIEGVRGTGYEGDTAIDDVKLGEEGDCVIAATTSVAPISTSEVGDGASCEHRCLLVTSDPLLCECTTDCITNNTCCPDFLVKCSPPSIGPLVVSTESPGSQDWISQKVSPIMVQSEIPTTSRTTIETTKLIQSSVSTNTRLPSSKASTPSVIKTSTVDDSSIKSSVQTFHSQLPVTIPTQTSPGTRITVLPNDRNRIFTSTNDSKTIAPLQPWNMTPVITRISKKPSVLYQSSTSVKSTSTTMKIPIKPQTSVKVTSVPTVSSSSPTIKTTTTKKPITKPRKVFIVPTIKPWIPKIASTITIRKIEFVTPPPPVVFRTPAKTTSFSTHATNKKSSTNTFVAMTSTLSPKLMKNSTKEFSKSRNDVLHPSWRKGLMPPPPPLPTLGPKPGLKTQKTTKSPSVKTTKTKLHENYLADQPLDSAESKWKSKYKPKAEEPIHAQFSTTTPASEVVHILVVAVGVLLLLASVLASVCAVRRRKINRRSIEDDDLDIRFLASDEILDFTLARPSMDEALICETSR
uniref:MAM domain-containing protein n=2 Tax=Graphocephala atropunctata TaxID=36148 RepID=A0A1B6MVJ5_9HEMI